MCCYSQWHVVNAGLVRLAGSNIEIHLMNEWTQGHRYEVRWNGRVVDRSFTLDVAKKQAEAWLRDLHFMGFYRG